MSKNNDLTTGNITKRITLLAIPLLLTSFLEMAYSFIDMIWIAKINSDAVSSVGTASFYLWLGFTLMQFVTIGTQTRSAQEIGNKQFEKAILYQKTGIQMALIAGILYGVIMFVMTPNFIGFFRIENDIVNANSMSYLKVCSLFMPSMFLNFTFTRIFNSKGISSAPFFINLVGSIMNIVFDPIFIFGWFGFEAMGVKGAAVATLLGNYTSTLIFIIYAFKKYEFLKFDLYKKIDLKIVKEILEISVPPGIYGLVFCVASMFVGRIISNFGSGAIAVQKVGSQLESITWNTVSSLSVAISAFVAQNYGAKELERIRKGFNSTLKICISIGIFATVLFTVFPHILLIPFFKESELIALGVSYFQVIAISQIFQCVELMTAGAFNGLGITKPASITGVTFNVLRIPLALVLSNSMGINGIWWAISITTILKGTVIFILYKNYEIKLGIRNITKGKFNTNKTG